jgi:SAM-dependent methyltransferase
MSSDTTHKMVQDAYAQIARKQDSSCCDNDGGKKSCCESKTAYAVPDHPVPEAELGLSCGNPLAFGHIHEGDVVLDLGSGAGKDVFLAAQKAGPAGRVIGVDMTPEMLALARKNAVKFFSTTGLANAEFRQGHIEQLPVEDAGVDVVVSNCVINLSPDKPRVFREIHRVLRPGGRMIVSDIVLNHPLSDEARSDAALYAACIAGAMLRDEYIQCVRDAGFETVTVLSDQSYKAPNAPADSSCCDAPEFPAAAAASLTVLAVR